MKPKVVSITLLVEPLPADPGDDWDEDSFECAIEDAVDAFCRSVGRHHLKLLDYHNGVTEGLDKSMDLMVDHDPSRPYPSAHSLLSGTPKQCNTALLPSFAEPPERCGLEAGHGGECQS